MLEFKHPFLVTLIEICTIDINIGVIAKKSCTYLEPRVMGLWFIVVKTDDSGK